MTTATSILDLGTGRRTISRRMCSMACEGGTSVCPANTSTMLVGSRLFDAICDLPEYYPTRTELGILRHVPADMAHRLGPKVALIEFGSGSSVKTRLVLDALDHPAAYLPVDISREHLREPPRNWPPIIHD